jgi:hypothetical protein
LSSGFTSVGVGIFDLLGFWKYGLFNGLKPGALQRTKTNQLIKSKKIHPLVLIYPLENNPA